MWTTAFKLLALTIYSIPITLNGLTNVQDAYFKLISSSSWKQLEASTIVYSEYVPNDSESDITVKATLLPMRFSTFSLFEFYIIIIMIEEKIN